MVLGRSVVASPGLEEKTAALSKEAERLGNPGVVHNLDLVVDPGSDTGSFVVLDMAAEDS
jgi:hypothetical protein